MKDLIRRVQRWSLNHIGRGPIVTSSTHALVTVLGLVPVPFGPFAIWYFIVTTHSWPWIVSSGITLVWYWRREYLQNGIERKDEYIYVEREPDDPRGEFERRTLLERYDPWLDVGVPTFAYGLLCGLLGWLW